jgi:hypothetical protein
MLSLEKFLRRFLHSVDHMAFVCQWMTVVALASIAGLLWGIANFKFPLSVPVLRLSESQFAIAQEHLAKIPPQGPLVMYHKGEKLTFALQNITVYQNDKMMLTVLPIFMNSPETESDNTRYVSYRLEVGTHRLFDIVFSKKEAQL